MTFFCSCPKKNKLLTNKANYHLSIKTFHEVSHFFGMYRLHYFKTLAVFFIRAFNSIHHIQVLHFERSNYNFLASPPAKLIAIF